MTEDFEVELDLVIHAPIKIRVKASDKAEALEHATSRIPLNLGDASKTRNGGWKATVIVQAPKGVDVKATELKATAITAAGGGEKVKKLDA
jgi:hypothetical protein